jgi:SAM-dependent methyltransferase
MDMKKTKKTFNCLISGDKITKILDFGMHPYADTFIGEDLLDLSEPVYPLEVYLNKDSGGIQLGYISNDFERYNLYSYSYTSSNSDFAKNHWSSYYENLVSRFNLEQKNIIEIGSNDGYLISKFKDNNNVLAVDSSLEMCNITKTNNINTFHKVFNSDVNDILENFGEADLIIANNVFNHSNNPLDFANGVVKLLKNDGVFVFELPYWLDTFNSGKFDQIYHEHISYFTVKSTFNLLKKINLEIIDFDLVDYHGGSIRVFSKKSKNVKMIDKVKKQINLEEDKGLFDVSTYDKWYKSIKTRRNTLLLELLKIKKDNPDAIIIGVGAAAKANTFLNYYRIDKTIVDYITDASKHKIGKFTPLTRIPIKSDEIFKNYDDVYALILSWNISNDLKNTLLKINPNIKFIEL